MLILVLFTDFDYLDWLLRIVQVGGTDGEGGVEEGGRGFCHLYVDHRQWKTLRSMYLYFRQYFNGF